MLLRVWCNEVLVRPERSDDNIYGRRRCYPLIPDEVLSNGPYPSKTFLPTDLRLKVNQMTVDIRLRGGNNRN